MKDPKSSVFMKVSFFSLDLNLRLFGISARRNVNKMEEKQLYRKQVMDRLSSPEDLNDYLKVTNPAVWVVLAAIILIIAGALIWGSTVNINSKVTGAAEVSEGKLIVTFEDESGALNVKEGLEIKVGEVSSTITSVGRNSEGKIIAMADTTLSDGSYTAEVRYRTTQLFKLIFN